MKLSLFRKTLAFKNNRIMRTRQRAGALCLVLMFLCGCQINSGQYYAEYPHNETNDAAGMLNERAISSPSDLKSAILSIVDSFETSDSIIINNYPGNLDSDLSTITQGITVNYPLGAYAVSSISFSQIRILSYVELGVSVQYRRTTQELNSIRRVSDSTQLPTLLSQLFNNFSSQLVLSFDSYSLTDTLLSQMIQGAWYNSAETALGLKGVSLTSYPAQNSGARIMEISVEYLEENDALQKQSEKLLAAASQIALSSNAKTGEQKLDFIYQWLSTNVTYDAEAMHMVSQTSDTQPKTSTYTGYGALIEKKAAQSGLALGARLLCDQLGLESSVVLGDMANVPHVWLKVKLNDQWMHFDVTSGLKTGTQKPSSNSWPEPGTAKYLFNTQEAQQILTWNYSLYGY